MSLTNSEIDAAFSAVSTQLDTLAGGSPESALAHESLIAGVTAGGPAASQARSNASRTPLASPHITTDPSAGELTTTPGTQQPPTNAGSAHNGTENIAQDNRPTMDRSSAPQPQQTGNSERPSPAHALPSGDAQSLQDYVESWEQALGCSITLGAPQALRSIPWMSSAGEIAQQDITNEHLIASISEASYATNGLHYAATGGQTSSVLGALRSETGDPLILSLGLAVGRDAEALDGGVDVGVVLRVEQREALRDKEFYGRAVQQLRREFCSWLEVWLLCRQGRASRRFQSLRNSLRGSRAKIIASVMAAILVVLAVPVPYRPSRPCTVEPASRIFLSSPIDGNIMESLVRPGDRVNAGQLIAKMDVQQIEWDLAAAEAEYEAAGKRRDSALASRAGSDLRIAQLEQERIALEISSLEKQLDQMQLVSPIDGVVVQGDWFQSSGAPVELGETLFEIAPLDKMRIETQLTQEDLAHVFSGTQLTANIQAADDHPWKSQLVRIDPRGQTVDSSVCFIAESEIENHDATLRPGMKGHSRLDVGWKSIGWQLFHRPYAWVMQKLYW